MLIALINVNHSNLNEDMIKFYISNVFEFFYTNNSLALCNEYSFYKAAIYNLNSKFKLNFDNEISNDKEENKFLQKIPFQLEKVLYFRFLSRFNSRLREMCDSLIKYEKINNDYENEEVNQLFNL